ncbi:MAG: polyphosphate kinase 2 [Candidatus Melainabacteria bacterium]|nr:MAG: polyphosphate kinase 2 [Candidatus Melainabacteria bacterium]
MSDNAGAANGKASSQRSSVKSTAVEKNGRNGIRDNDAEIQSEKPETGKIDADDLARVNTQRGLLKLLKSKNIKLKSVLNEMNYEEELVLLQIELVKLQRWAQKNGKRIAILFEGRDAAGKGGAIRRFTEHLNPRSMRVVALPKPSEVETGQWYFQRYSVQLPSAGEIVFFDRSWYNRAVVEPVNGFCTEEEYDRFMQQVTEYEHMLYEDGITIIKFWFSITREEQMARFTSRRVNPLKQWKLSPIDEKAQDLWQKYSHYKELMFSRTHTSFSPWIIVQANNKKKARLESIRYVLSTLDYSGKDTPKTQLFPDPNIVQRYHRNSANQD